MDQVPADFRLSTDSSETMTCSQSAATAVEEWIDPRATDQARRAALARQVSGRRRFVDPTTCERDYSVDEMEFMKAIQIYKKESGRNFPTCCEILEVMISLGYQKVAPPLPEPGSQALSTTARGSEPRR